ncbi:sugar phosphate isomerase/epimerase [bacterium]|nr:sugar phosphate isomerase/epimerase [bacterium]
MTRLRAQSGKNQNNFGFNSFSRPLEDVLDYAIAKNLGHIELNLTEEQSTLNSYSPERIDRIVRLLDDAGINLSFHLPLSVNIAGILSIFQRSDYKYVTNIIDLASSLNAAHITMHAGHFSWFPNERWMRHKAMFRFIRVLENFVTLCQHSKVVIALENSVPATRGLDYCLLGDHPEDFEYVFSRCNSEHIKFCLDIGHANMDNSILDYIKHFGSKLASVHFHDNNGKRDEHLAPGLGIVDWKTITQKLDEVHFSGPYISECKNIKPHESVNLLMDLWAS